MTGRQPMNDEVPILTSGGQAGHGLASLARDFGRFAGPRLWLLLLLMTAGSVAEGFGLLMIVPLAAIALGEGSSLPQWVAAPFSSFSRDGGLMLAAGMFLLAMALRSLLLVWRDTLRGRLEADYRASLQLRSASTLAAAGWAKASRIGQAGMQSLLLNDVPRAVMCLALVMEFATAAIFLSVQFALAAWLSPLLALFALVVLAPGLLLLVGSARRLVRSGEALSQGSEETTGAGIRLHSGLKAALAQGSTGQFLGEYRASLGRLAGEYVRFTRDLSLARQLSVFSTAVAAVILLVVGGRLLEIPFPVLAASLVLFARMAAPAVSLLQSAQGAIAAAPAYVAIERRLGPLSVESSAAAKSAAPLDWSRLDVESVSFRHRTGGGFENLSVSLERGVWLGIRGPSAAGKTTLVDVIVGLHKAQAGAVLVDRKPLAGERLEQWRAGIAYLAQEGLVFADSVAANLAAGQGAIDERTMWDSLTAVGLAARVRSFADGLYHPLGEGGSALSGGERQRLLIARAILRRPTLIVLDEATAALDPEAEASIISALKRLPSRPAALLIAHRESSLARCDSVLDLQHPDNGREPAC